MRHHRRVAAPPRERRDCRQRIRLNSRRLREAAKEALCRRSRRRSRAGRRCRARPPACRRPRRAGIGARARRRRRAFGERRAASRAGRPGPGPCQCECIRRSLALDDEVALVDGAAIGDRELGQRALEEVAPDPRRLRELAERELAPVKMQLLVADVPPRRVERDRANRDEQVDISHRFRHDKRGHVLERERVGLLPTRRRELQPVRCRPAGSCCLFRRPPEQYGRLR